MRTVWRGRPTGGSIPRSDSRPDSPSIVTRAAVPSLPPIESPAAGRPLSIMSGISQQRRRNDPNPKLPNTKASRPLRAGLVLIGSRKFEDSRTVS